MTHKQHSIGNLMFTNSSTQDDHSRLFRFYRHIIQSPYILYNIYRELSFGFVSMEIDHVAKGTVCQGRTEHWDIVLNISLDLMPLGLTYLVTPIVYTLLIIDLLP